MRTSSEGFSHRISNVTQRYYMFTFYYIAVALLSFGGLVTSQSYQGKYKLLKIILGPLISPFLLPLFLVFIVFYGFYMFCMVAVNKAR